MEDIIVLGCGALGSRIAMEIATPGVSMLLLDFDTVEHNNVASRTTTFRPKHIGFSKADKLAGQVYRLTGTKAFAAVERLTAERVEAYDGFDGARLVLDCFDNIPARALTMHGIVPPVLHVAVSAMGTGLVAWNDAYELPPEIAGETPVCTHQLGRRILMWTAMVASMSALEFLETGRMKTRVTGRDFKVWG